MKQHDQNYEQELIEAHSHWKQIYENGCSDPFCEDGVNLNLVRNHIIGYRSKLEESPSLFGLPDVYHKEIPPKVDNHYMARSDEIRAAAKISLSKYKADPNFQYIALHRADFTPKTRKRLCIDNVIGYVLGLENYIKEDKLVDMRRHELYERYLLSFKDCAQRMEAAPPETIQMTLFDLSDYEYDEEEGDNDDMEM